MLRRFAFVAVCSFSLGGCVVETEATVHLSDILAVAKTGQADKVAVRYLLEVPTKDKCLLYGQKIAEILKPHMAELTDVACVRRDLSDFVAITGSAPLIRGGPCASRCAADEGQLMHCHRDSETKRAIDKCGRSPVPPAERSI
ncbi:MAG: hypothetical protein HY852_13700 [Bradyrhizobium sp.]|uniref:hypothetical protein n=1 Tax=Bradyrhizobium sp. TaxID=376 RepID=UPI0025BCBF4C|nr:hypothetical protein [Bradyrhizobium sp.]MBI5262862.1 hypothetical protein [Bradyrhizobium sp.]